MTFKMCSPLDSASTTRPAPFRPSRPLPGARAALLSAALAAVFALQGCGVLAVGAVAGGSAIVAVDRRTAGTQLEDKTIEVKVGQRVREALADKANVNATAYNRSVLLTGEVPTDAARANVERLALQVENVKGVINELTVGFPSSLSARANDGIIAGKVRAKMIEAADVPASAFKITVEAGVVYLMGMVSEAESRRATQLAASVSGVKKVVRALETLSPEEVMRLRSKADGTR